MLDIQGIIAIIGAIAFFAGLFGGFKVKDIEIPALPITLRLFAFFAGVVFIGIAIYPFILEKILPTIPTTSPTPSSISSQNPPPTSSSNVDPKLFSDNFDNGDLSKWKLEMETGGSSVIESGQFILDGTGVVFAGSNIWENYSVKATVKILSFDRVVDFGLFTRAKDGGILYVCQQVGDEVWLNKYANSGLRLDTGNYKPVINQSFEMQMDVQGNIIKCYANGLEIASGKDSSHASGRFGFRVVDTKIAIDDVEVFPLP